MPSLAQGRWRAGGHPWGSSIPMVPGRSVGAPMTLNADDVKCFLTSRSSRRRNHGRGAECRVARARRPTAAPVGQRAFVACPRISAGPTRVTPGGLGWARPQTQRDDGAHPDLTAGRPLTGPNRFTDIGPPTLPPRNGPGITDCVRTRESSTGRGQGNRRNSGYGSANGRPGAPAGRSMPGG